MKRISWQLFICILILFDIVSASNAQIEKTNLQEIIITSQCSIGRYNLNKAIRNNDINHVTTYIHDGLDINEADIDSGTPLINALLYKKNEIAKLLIEAGADVNKQSQNGMNPLIISSELNNIEMMELLINKGGEKELQLWDGRTALLCAVEKGNMDALKLLINRGVNIHALDSNNRDALRIAADNNKIEVLEYLQQQGLTINAVDKYGWTPLLWSTYKGKLDLVKYLLKQKADINSLQPYGIGAIQLERMDKIKWYEELVSISRKEKVDWNILHIAAISNNPDLVKFLISDKKIDINSTNKLMNTPLIIAVKFKQSTITKLLIELGANINLKNSNGSTALIEACINNNLEIATILLSKKANVNDSDVDGITAFLYSIKYGSHNLIELLIKNGADVNAKDKNGNSSLHYALASNMQDKDQTIEMLLLNGANINAINQNGDAPIFYALKNNNYQAINVLIKHNVDLLKQNGQGYPFLHSLLKSSISQKIELLNYVLEKTTDINLRSTQNETPLIIACSKNEPKIVEKLLQMEADPNLQNNYGNFALIATIGSENKDSSAIVELLLKRKGINLEQKNIAEETALIRAVNRFNFDIAEKLIKAGANINIKNTKGDSILISTLSKSIRKKYEIINFLIKNGINIDSTNLEGETALMKAVIENDIDSVKILIEQNANKIIKDKKGNTAISLAENLKNNNIYTLLTSDKNGSKDSLTK